MAPSVIDPCYYTSGGVSVEYDRRTKQEIVDFIMLYGKTDIGNKIRRIKKPIFRNKIIPESLHIRILLLSRKDEFMNRRRFVQYLKHKSPRFDHIHNPKGLVRAIKTDETAWKACIIHYVQYVRSRSTRNPNDSDYNRLYLAFIPTQFTRDNLKDALSLLPKPVLCAIRAEIQRSRPDLQVYTPNPGGGVRSDDDDLTSESEQEDVD